MFHRSYRTYGLVALMAATFGGCSAADEEALSGEAPAGVVAATASLELVAAQDARTQGGSPETNFGAGILWTNTASHHSFVQFDMLSVPTGVLIERAVLKLNFNGNYAGTNTVEVGNVAGEWEESSLTWANQPSITWGGATAVVGDAAGDVRFDVTGIVRQWLDGSLPNYGLALRSTTPGGKQYDSRETNADKGPRLEITYRLANPAPGPDVGDAPDSSNHHGIGNTAYIGGVLGQFPTVFLVPAGQAAGPRHANPTMQGLLGNFISREPEADLGPDQDGRNNILMTPAGVVVDTSNWDRADEGWLNRNIRFYNCERQKLKVRVTRPLNAGLPQMYLNVWFDGTRDGDWNDTLPCFPPGGGAPQPRFEWIVQNEVVNLAAIAPGQFVDLEIETERVLNATEGLPHWMRFTLSDAPAVQPAGLPADGRGPHPTVSAFGYAYGETEDYIQLPPAPVPPDDQQSIR